MFHLLPQDQLAVGVAKATRLREQLSIPGDELLWCTLYCRKTDCSIKCIPS
jgi:hypothetical protein